MNGYSEYVEEIFKRVVREELKKLLELTGINFTEELLRRIIREELKKLLESMGKTAYNADGYETRELESAGLAAIRTVVESEAFYMPHDWECEKRVSSWKTCTCGAGEDET